jgi:hypothetical protein
MEFSRSSLFVSEYSSHNRRSWTLGASSVGELDDRRPRDATGVRLLSIAADFSNPLSYSKFAGLCCSFFRPHNCIFAHRRVACTAKLGGGSAQFDDATDEIDEDLEDRDELSDTTDSGEDFEEIDEADLAEGDCRGGIESRWDAGTYCAHS